MNNLGSFWEDFYKTASGKIAPMVGGGSGVIQTQQDVHAIADTAQQFQTPEVQAQIKNIEVGAASYAGLSLFFQGVVAVVLVLNYMKQNK